MCEGVTCSVCEHLHPDGILTGFFNMVVVKAQIYKPSQTRQLKTELFSLGSYQSIHKTDKRKWD